MSDKSDWIDWGGGECPVAPDVMVMCWMACDRSESDIEGWCPIAAGKMRWSHIGSGGDIIKYRVIGESK